MMLLVSRKSEALHILMLIICCLFSCMYVRNSVSLALLKQAWGLFMMNFRVPTRVNLGVSITQELSMSIVMFCEQQSCIY